MQFVLSLLAPLASIGGPIPACDDAPSGALLGTATSGDHGTPRIRVVGAPLVGEGQAHGITQGPPGAPGKAPLRAWIPGEGWRVHAPTCTSERGSSRTLRLDGYDVTPRRARHQAVDACPRHLRPRALSPRFLKLASTPRTSAVGSNEEFLHASATTLHRRALHCRWLPRKPRTGSGRSACWCSRAGLGPVGSAPS